MKIYTYNNIIVDPEPNVVAIETEIKNATMDNSAVLSVSWVHTPKFSKVSINFELELSIEDKVILDNIVAAYQQ